MTTTIRTLTATVAAALVLTLATACTTSTTPAPEQTTTAPAVQETPAPVETSAPVETTEPEIVADENSQVIDGVLYQGTEIAPVRIGDDTPGQEPALEATIPDTSVGGTELVAIGEQVEDAGKYLVTVTWSLNGSNERDGYCWIVDKRNEWGNIKSVANQGLTTGDPLATVDEAAAGPFVVDGRTLDRAEYVLIIVL